MRLPSGVRFAGKLLGHAERAAALVIFAPQESEEEHLKAKHWVVLAFLLASANACSDDDQGMGDPCQNACGKLSACGTGVICGGVTIPPSTCVSNCQRRQAVSAANCVIQVPACTELDKLQNCAAQMPCS